MTEADAARRRRAAGAAPRSPRSTRSRRARPTGCATLARAITAGAPTTLRQGPGDRERGSARTRTYSLERAAVAAGRRRRRRLPVPHPRRLVRAGREQPRRDGAQRRHPGPARDRLRARRAATRSTGRFVVRERDAHAWAEIYFPGIGWQGSTRPRRCRSPATRRPGGSWLADRAAPRVSRSAARGALVLVAARGARRDLLAAVAPPARRPRVVERGAALAPAGARRPQGRAGPRAPAETPREYAARARRDLGDERIARRSATRSTPTCSRRAARRRIRARDADAVLSSLRP